MSSDLRAAVIADAGRVDELAAELAAAGCFAFDLEFVSESRYVPELALLQVGWRAGDDIRVAAIDCVAVEPSAIFDLIGGEQVDVVAHAAKQDLGLLAARYQVRAHRLWDTQIAAAFLGIGEQIGYGRLIEHLLGRRLDKGVQYTNWLARPLTERQLRYALDDVRYLLPAWTALRERLEERGRLGWVAEESDALAEQAARISDPELIYREVKGGARLEPRALGALRALAAWREREARRRNKPPSWILPDRAMVDACRLLARTMAELGAVRGIGEGILRRRGRDILAQIAAGADGPPPPLVEAAPALETPAQLRATIAGALVQARCVAEEVAARFVGTRADVEALVAWFERGCPADEPRPPLLVGWRSEMVGDALLRWLRGEAALAVDPTDPGGLRIVNR